MEHLLSIMQLEIVRNCGLYFQATCTSLNSKPDTKIELAFTFIYGSFTFSFYVFLNNYSLYIVQVAVGFEYEGKTEKHESQKGWKYVVLVFKIIM